MTSLPTAIWILAVHVLLTLLPVVTGLLVALAFGVRDRLLLLSIGLCSLLVTGYLTFWIFWSSAAAGRIFAVVLTPALVVVVVWLGVPRRADLKEIGAEFLRPLLLWVASSVLIFAFVAMYPSSHTLTTTAESRFVPALPIDNEVPLITANALQSSHRPLPHPLYGIWDSSDRPPLQAGVYLSQEALLPGSDTQAVHYEVVGILLQGLWIFGIWGLFAAVRARTRLAALALTAILFSGFALVNTFFTWPKLFAAAYLALLAAMLLTPNFKSLRSSALAGATAGALAGAALLGHEGSLLALLAFVIVMAVQRRWPSRRFVLGAAALLVITQGSWLVYQKVIDPPGDQLARLQIANQIVLPGERGSLLTVIVSEYEKTPFGSVVSDKVSNLETPFDAVPTYIVNTTRLVESYFMEGRAGFATRHAAVGELTSVNFFYLVPTLGFLSLGFFAWLAAAIRNRRQRSSPVFRLAGTLWLFLIVNIITWALIFFGPSATFIHQGTYATELLAFAACIIGLWELAPWLCAGFVFVQASLAVLLYGFNGPPQNVTHRLDAQMLILTILALAMTLGALWICSTGSQISADEQNSGAQEWRTYSSDDASPSQETEGMSQDTYRIGV